MIVVPSHMLKCAFVVNSAKSPTRSPACTDRAAVVTTTDNASLRVDFTNCSSK